MEKAQVKHAPRDHGGGLDLAVLQFGGTRDAWIDLSTGINPHPFPFTSVPTDVWTALPDKAAQNALIDAARAFWSVPAEAAILAVPGASAVIAQIPRLRAPGTVRIVGPTYNEHAAAFAAQDWAVTEDNQPADAQVIVHPNNPTGQCWQPQDLNAPLRIIDESFCDVMPDRSMVAQTTRDDTLVLKSFGKFWGLAGVRLGFVIGPPALVSQLADMLGPWPVSGAALHIGRQALTDLGWVRSTRVRLETDANRLDNLMVLAGAQVAGGTTLFRLYEVDDAKGWQRKLAQSHIWSRTFPYSRTWLRLGLPPVDGWSTLETAI